MDVRKTHWKLPADLIEAIEALAQRERRSVVAQAEILLRKALEGGEVSVG